MKKQTAVEWFIEQLEEKGDLRETPSIRNIQLNIDTTEYLDLKRQAKEMEKEHYTEFEVLQLLLKLQQTESYDNLYDWFEENKKNIRR